MLNGILWILRTGAPSRRRLAEPRESVDSGACHTCPVPAWRKRRAVKPTLLVASTDGSFAPAKKGGAGVGTTKRGKGSKIMAIADSAWHGPSLFTPTVPHRMKVTLVEATLAHRLVQKTPERLIGERVRVRPTRCRARRSVVSTSSRVTAGTARAGRRMVGAPPVSTPMEDGTVV